MDTNQFLLGQQLAKDGKQLDKNSHPDFIRGYEAEIGLKEIMGEVKKNEQ